MTDEFDELLRSRERLHKMESTLIAVDWRLKRVEADVTDMKPRVAALATSAEIADAVSERMDSDRTFRLTRWQRFGAFAVGLAAVVDVIVRIALGA